MPWPTGSLLTFPTIQVSPSSGKPACLPITGWGKMTQWQIHTVARSMSRAAVTCGQCPVSAALGQHTGAREPETIFLTTRVPSCTAGTHPGSVVKTQPVELEA